MAEKSADYKSPVAQKVTTMLDSTTLMSVKMLVMPIRC